MTTAPHRGLAHLLLPAGVAAHALPLLQARALRALGDGYMALLLPAYLLALGLDGLAVGLISTATMLGSALATLAVGAWGHRYAGRRLLLGAAALMAATGLGFALLGPPGMGGLWPLAVVAFVGTLNPSSGDVSVFLPLEHARLAAAAPASARTALFARYSVIGALCAALGALAAALPDWAAQQFGFERLTALRALFIAYAGIGVGVALLYRRLPADDVIAPSTAPSAASAASAASGATSAKAPLAAAAARSALGPSRQIVWRLAALFSVDSFAGGLLVNAVLSVWLLQRFGFSLAESGVFFFWAGLLSAASQLAAPWVAQRIGLLNTMVFTHLPANVCLVLAALAPDAGLALTLLFVRAALSQMDVPTRSAYVMAVVTPAERAAAASFTAVPRSLAAALSPTLSGALLGAGFIALPLVACGGLKIVYDLVLWRMMRSQRLDQS
jgi:MFS family permease